MASTVNLREKAYKSLKENSQDDKRKLIEVIDEIENYIIYEKPQLIVDIESKKIPKKALDDEIDRYIKLKKISLDNTENYEEILSQVNDYIWGYGSLQPYLNDLKISDVRVLDIKNDAWIKQDGRWKKIPIEFSNYKKLKEFCYSIAIKNGGNLSNINAIQILSDTKFIKEFNLRITLSIDPVNSKSPSIVIRKIPKEKPNLEQLMNLDMIDLQQYVYFKRNMQADINILLCGKGASGKTTLMNALIEYIPEEQSKLMVQESDEITSKKGNWQWKHIVKKQGESDVEYSLQYLITIGMLETLDRIYIGEVKGPEAMDIIDAGYSGHTIGFTTHTKSSREAIPKTISNMKKSGTDYKAEDLKEILASTIDVIIYMENFKVIEVTEVANYDIKTQEIIYNPVFRFITTKKKNGISEGYWQKLNNSCEKIQKKLNVIDFQLD